MVLDSGSSQVMLQEEGIATDWKEMEGEKRYVQTAGGGKLEVTKEGGVAKLLNFNPKTRNWELAIYKNCILVPGLIANLIGTRGITRNGGKATFEDEVVVFQNAAGEKARISVDKDKDLYCARMIVADHDTVTPKTTVAFFTSPTQEDSQHAKAQLWHRRMGHASKSAIAATRVKAVGHDIPSTAHSRDCDTCRVSRARSKSSQAHRVLTEKLQLVSADVIVDLRKAKEARHVLVVIDNFTKFTWTFPLRHKSEAFDNIRTWLARIKLEAGTAPREIRVDQGELWSSAFKALCDQNGIILTASATQEHTGNAVAERRIQDVERVARSLLSESRLAESMWPHAIDHATYLINRTASQALGGDTPLAKWSGKETDLSNLRVFGCLCYVVIKAKASTSWNRASQLQSKHLRDRAVRGVYLGYSQGPGRVKGHRVLIPLLNRIVVARDVEFAEDRLYDARLSSGTQRLHGAVTGSDYVWWGQTAKRNTNDSVEQANLRRYSRQAEQHRNDQEHGTDVADLWEDQAEEDDPVSIDLDVDTSRAEVLRELSPLLSLPDAEGDIVDDIVGSSDDSGDIEDDGSESGNESEDPIDFLTHVPAPTNSSERLATAFIVTHDAMAMAAGQTLRSADGVLLEPLTLAEAKRRDDWGKWRAAMEEEMAAMESMEVWDVVEPPADAKLVSSRWVFKLKLDEQRRASRYRARLVARGFTQREGLDYDETFSPVARLTTIRSLLAYAAHYGLYCHAMDVKTAFLNGAIDKDVFLRIAPDFETKENQGKAYKLKKAIYGLKQAGRLWNLTLDEQLQHFGYRKCASEPCVYHRGSGDARIIIIVYVDDLVVIGANEKRLASAKSQLKTCFSMTDLGPLKFVLGIEVEYSAEQRTCRLNQIGYLQGLFVKYKVSDDAHPRQQPALNTLDDMTPNTETVATPDEIHNFASIIGSLQWLAGGTRPDIAFSVGRCARFLANPSKAHFRAVHQILLYLKGTVDYKLTYGKDSKALVAYSDSDWAGERSSRRSTTGYVFMIYGATVSWTSRLQPTVALSSVEAEYLAMSTAAREMLWLVALLKEIGNQVQGPVNVAVTETTHALRSGDHGLLLDASVPILASDSAGARVIAANPEHHKRTKHIDVRHHHLRELVQADRLRITTVKGTENPADIFTKALSTVTLHAMAKLLGLG